MPTLHVVPGSSATLGGDDAAGEGAIHEDGAPHEEAIHLSGMALAALITALVGMPIVSVVLGILARRDIRESGGALRGMPLAIAGIVIGSLGVLWWAGVCAVIAFAAWSGSGSDGPDRSLPQHGTVHADGTVTPIDPTTDAPVDATRPPGVIPPERRSIVGEPDVSLLVKRVVDAVEACAAHGPGGNYDACGPAAISASHPELADALRACGAPGGACIRPAGTAVTVMARGRGALASATYIEDHTATGQVVRRCTAPPDIATSCSNGRWG